MYPKGTVYFIHDPKKSGTHGEVYLHASLAVKVLYNIGRTAAAGLIGSVIIAVLFTFGPLIKQEVSYDLYKPSVVDIINAQNTSIVQNEAKNFGVDSYFSIVIPKINAKANIIANVDPTNEKEYDKALMEGVAHAKGTYFPGQGKEIFLFAHSTNSILNVSRYNAVFYLLDKMAVGDKIIVYFADKRYLYGVTQTKILKPTDVTPLQDQTTGEELVLQTCYPPGTSWNRLLIFAKPIDK